MFNTINNHLMEKIEQIVNYKTRKVWLSQELYNILKINKINKEGNFINWENIFNHLDIVELIELYNYFWVATFKNKTKLKNINQSILFFENFIDSFSTNLEKYSTIEKQLQLYLEKWISYYGILFKINILVNYLHKVKPEYKLKENIQKEILNQKANTSRTWQKNYWPNIIKKLNTENEILDFYKSNNTNFLQISKNINKITSISFFYCLSNKIKQLNQNKKTTKFINTLNNYLIKLWYLQSNKIVNKVSNREDSLNSISNKDELQLYYTKLVKIKFFNQKLKEKENKQYINYLNIIVNKIIFLYKEIWQNPLNNILSINKILKFKSFLNNEQINILEQISNTPTTKKQNRSYNKSNSKTNSTKKIVWKKTNKVRKNTNLKIELDNKKKIEILINKLKYKQFYKQSYEELKVLLNKDNSLDNKLFSKLVSLLRTNDLLELSKNLKISEEQKKEIILNIFFSNITPIILIKDEHIPLIEKYTKITYKLIKNEKLQEDLKCKLLKLKNR